jgi:hypothetical protein
MKNLPHTQTSQRRKRVSCGAEEKRRARVCREARIGLFRENKGASGRDAAQRRVGDVWALLPRMRKRRQENL